MTITQKSGGRVLLRYGWVCIDIVGINWGSLIFALVSTINDIHCWPNPSLPLKCRKLVSFAYPLRLQYKFSLQLDLCYIALRQFFFPGNILPLSLRESDGTYQMTSSGDNEWLSLAPGQLHLSHPVESISFFKFEIPWDSSLHNSRHLDRWGVRISSLRAFLILSSHHIVLAVIICVCTTLLQFVNLFTNTPINQE